jgi:hypothetical protein
MKARPSPLSSRPKRTRVSCHAEPDTTTYAAFIEESRMKLANATNLYRKSGVAQRRDLRCAPTPSQIRPFFLPYNVTLRSSLAEK